MGKAVPPSHTPIDNTAAAVAERWWLLVERWNSLLENIPILLPRTPRKPGTLHWCLAHKLKQQWETHPWPEVAGMWASPGRTLAHGHTISPPPTASNSNLSQGVGFQNQDCAYKVSPTISSATVPPPAWSQARCYDYLVIFITVKITGAFNSEATQALTLSIKCLFYLLWICNIKSHA